MRPLTIAVTVHRIHVVATDTVSIELRPEGNEPLPTFDAGSHISLHLPNGIVRSYSLINVSDSDNRYVIAVLRSPQSQGGSAFIHEHLHEGDALIISSPRNNFPLDETGERFVLIAGGIGITPIYSMAQRLASLGKSVDMFYCCRTRAHAAWLEPIRALGIPLTLHFDNEAGCSPDLAAFIAGRGHGTRYYCCGPSPMLTAFEQACEKYRYSHIHIERFSANPANIECLASHGYDAVLARSGKRVHVEPNERLIDVLLAAGVDVPFSCRQGICGSCETAVLEGEVDHRDSVLSDAERADGKTMMVCVSGCKGNRLVLDC